MEKGWDAADLINGILSSRRERGLPYTQEWLAEQTGIRRESINAYLTDTQKRRRSLGIRNATKIADALGVSLYDIGAPRPSTADFAASLLGRIVLELRQNPPQDATHLLELATELRGLAADLEEVATAQSLDGPP